MSSATKAPMPEVAPGTIVVAETGEGLSQYLLDGRHVLQADEPVSAGGKDLGPGPYELLLMSLGACTSMTIRLYANRKGWPLERVIVRLRHFRDYATDCQAAEAAPVLLDHMERKIELLGALDDAQRQRLLEIAEHCPVHRTLTSKIKILTSLEAAS